MDARILNLIKESIWYKALYELVPDKVLNKDYVFPLYEWLKTLTTSDIRDYIYDELRDKTYDYIINEIEDYDEEGKKEIAGRALELVEEGRSLDRAMFEAENELSTSIEKRMADERKEIEDWEAEKRELNRWINAGGWHTAYGFHY